MKIAVFASGMGSNFSAILKSIKTKQITNLEVEQLNLQKLERLEFKIISTGGTAKLLAEEGVKVTGISAMTGIRHFKRHMSGVKGHQLS